MTEARFRTLVISLLTLNIFVLCALIGGGLTWLLAAQQTAPRLLPLAAEYLPTTQRNAFQRALAETRRTLKQTMLESHQAKVMAASLLEQPQLDQAALSSALEKARQTDIAVRAAVEQRAVEFAMTLPVEQRRLLAEGLLQRIAPKPSAAAK